MGLFGEVKCGRCDRRYSAIRGRCPYCGARKRRTSKNSGSGDSKARVVIGVIISVVVIAAVAYLVYNNLSEGQPKATPTPTATATPKPSTTPTATPTPTLPAATPTPGVKVTSVVLSRDDFTLSGPGDSWVLIATVSPTTASQTVTWTSQDTKVATVGSDGRVTAVAGGSTTITADAGGVKATCIVRVNGSSGSTSTPSPSNSSGLSLSHTDVTLNATTQESFKLTVNGSSSTPAYSSSNTAVATVDSSGNVKAVAAGTASIYVTVGSTKLECIVRVVKR